MFVYKVHSAQRFKEGYTDITNVLIVSLKNLIATQNVKQKFENLPTQPKQEFGVLRGKMSMDVTP